MKKLIFILSLSFIFLSNSSKAVSFLPESKRSNHPQQKEIPLKHTTPKNNPSLNSTAELNTKLNTLMKATMENAKLLKARSARPLIYDGKSFIQRTSVVRGTLLNSIRSTNLESPILISVDEGEVLPEGTKFDCIGLTKFKRVQTNCDTILLPGKTLTTNVTILNTDGSSGLTGEYYDGKEELIAGTVLMGGLSGLIASKETSLNTALGTVKEASGRNSAISSALSMAQVGTEIIKEEMSQKEPIVYINAGKKVLIYFKTDFNLRPRSPLVNLEEIKTLPKSNEENLTSNFNEEIHEIN